MSLIECVLLLFQNKDSESESKPTESDGTNVEEETSKEEIQDISGDSPEIVEAEKPDNEILLVSKPRTKSPWSLELFDDTKPENPQPNVEDASLLITSKGVHVIPPPITSKSPLLKAIKSKSGRFDPKLKRSLSQPYVNTSPYLKYGSGLFSLYRKPQRKRPTNLQNEEYASDFYLYTLIWACVSMLFWKNVMLLPFLPIPILIYIIKHVGLYLGVWSWIYGYWSKVRNVLTQWCTERSDALLPVPVRGLCRVVGKANTTLKSTIKESIDTVASCVVISALMVFAICASIFIVFQVCIPYVN